MWRSSFRTNFSTWWEVRKPPFDVDAAAKRDRFDLRDGVLFLKDAPDEPWLRMDLARLLRAVHFREQGDMLTVEVMYDPSNELPDWGTGRGNLSATYAYGTQGVEVEVDEETGEVRILRMVAAHDVGRVLNPQTLKGQVYGGLAQGIGYALYEEVLVDRGRILNPSFRDYKIPTSCELDFPIDLEFVETDDRFGPFGGKGVGEPGLVPTAPAIANAIYDAIGVRVHDLPPHAELDDGLLDALIMKGQSSLHRARGFARVRSGSHIESPQFLYRQVHQLRVSSRLELTVAPDGELAGVLPVRIDVCPQVVAIHCPPQHTSERTHDNIRVPTEEIGV